MELVALAKGVWVGGCGGGCGSAGLDEFTALVVLKSGDVLLSC